MTKEGRRELPFASEQTVDDQEMCYTSMSLISWSAARTLLAMS